MSLKGLINKCGVKLSKYSPQICLVLGIGAVLGGTVLACNATLKVQDKITERDNKLEDTKRKYRELLEVNDDSDEDDESTELALKSNHDYKNEVLKIHAVTAFNIAKDFAPAVICTGTGIGLLVHGHGTLNKRYLAMTAAYGGLQKTFNDYRENVKVRFGPEVDKELLYGAVDVTFTDPETNEEKIVKCVDVSKYGDTSMNTRILFSEVSPYWNKSAEANLAFISLTINNMNHKLASRGKGGVMFLNEVLTALGLPRTSAGQILGWVYDPDITSKIDASIYNAVHNLDAGTINFLDGDEPNVWLNFNVDGNVLELV